MFFQNRRRPRFQVSSCVLVNENASFLFQFSRGKAKSQAIGSNLFILSCFTGTTVLTRSTPRRASIEPMALGNLTKQLATQALNDQVNNVLDALRPGDPAKSTEPAKEKASAGSDN